jgi:hypothetical protein
MKFIFTFIFALVITISLQAQFKIKKDWDYDPTDNCFATKRVFVGIHYELPFNIKKNWAKYSNNGDFSASTIGPIGLHVEYAITPKIGMTANYSFVNSNVSWGVTEFDSIVQKSFSYSNGFAYQANSISAGAQNHIFYNKFVDAFIGAELGYTFYKYTLQSSNTKKTFSEIPSTHSPFHYMAYFGVRYFVVPKIGVDAKLGIGDISNAKLGLVYRFGY